MGILYLNNMCGRPLNAVRIFYHKSSVCVRVYGGMSDLFKLKVECVRVV